MLEIELGLTTKRAVELEFGLTIKMVVELFLPKNILESRVLLKGSLLLTSIASPDDALQG